MIVVDRLREHKVVIARQDVTVITYFVVFARLNVIGAGQTVLFAGFACDFRDIFPCLRLALCVCSHMFMRRKML